MKLLATLIFVFGSLSASANLNMKVPSPMEESQRQLMQKERQQSEERYNTKYIQSEVSTALYIREELKNSSKPFTAEEAKGNDLICLTYIPNSSELALGYPKESLNSMDSAKETKVGLSLFLNYSDETVKDQFCTVVYRRSLNTPEAILSEWSCKHDFYSKEGQEIPSLYKADYLAIQYQVCTLSPAK